MSPFWALEGTGAAQALHHPKVGWLNRATLARLADEVVAQLPPRSLFALEFPPTPEAVAAYLGGLRHRHVALLLDGELATDLKAALLAHFGIRHIFDGKRWAEAANRAGQPALHPDLGLLMSTSGSTGSPKLVRLSSANMQANAASIAEYLGLTAKDRAISSLPLHYSYGLSVLNSHLAAGACMVLNGHTMTTETFWQAFKEHGITSLAGVPTTWRMLRQMRFERMNLPSLRTMTQAGGHLEPAEIEWLSQVAQRQGRHLFIMYGQTEASPRIAYLPAEMVARKFGSIGQAIPGGTLRLIDSNGNSIEAANVEGELVYRGPNVMLGYAESMDDLARGRDIDELRTGDLALRDADGHYWITGRMKRFIKLFGNRFGLDDVERQLRARGLEAAAVGRDDLLMVGLVGTPTQAEALRGELARYYRIHVSAVSVHAIDVLPCNSTGKVRHGELLDQLSNTAD